MAEWFKNVAKIILPTPLAIGDVNVFIVKGDTLTLIDAGVKTREAWEKLVFELKSIGYRPEDIEQVILTHHHPDHVGLLDFLPDIPVYAHEKAERWLYRTEDFMEEYRSFYRKLFLENDVPTDLLWKIRQMEGTLKYSCTRKLTGYLREGMEVPGLSGWYVLETPGHAQSHLSFFNETSGLMIAGDHILAMISSNPLLEPPQHAGEERPKPQIQYNESLQKVKDLPVDLVLCGHGMEVKNLPGLVTRRLDRQHARALKVKAMIEGQELTGFEICRRLFPEAYERELNLTMSETIGQLDYLESIGLVRKFMDTKGIIFYRSC